LAEFKIRNVKYYIEIGEGFLSFSSCCFVFSSPAYNRNTKTQITLIGVLFLQGFGNFIIHFKRSTHTEVFREQDAE